MELATRTVMIPPSLVSPKSTSPPVAARRRSTSIRRRSPSPRQIVTTARCSRVGGELLAVDRYANLAAFIFEADAADLRRIDGAVIANAAFMERTGEEDEVAAIALRRRQRVARCQRARHVARRRGRADRT